MPFQGLGLMPVLCQNLSREGYTEPTPIQSQGIPIALTGRDLMGGAQTGTGKTAAFALPMIQRLLLEPRPADGPRSTFRSGVPRHPWGLVLAPTRELAIQVNEAFVTYGRDTGLRSTAIYGGVGMQPQVNVLRRGVHVVVATPGRLLDHLGQGTLRLSEIEILTIDEADRMLDLGFLPDLKRILRVLPEKRQTLLFSATLSDTIQELARQYLVDPERVQVAPKNAIASLVQHRMHPVEDARKRDLLVHILSEDEDRRSLVFCRTKSGSDRLTRHLENSGFRAVAIHGNKSQTARIKALNDFKTGRSRVLVATDIAARGLDIEQLPIVINFDLPLVPEDYIHRIGRTGRAGSTGNAISLVTPAQASLLNDIRRLLKDTIAVETVPGFESPHLAVLSRPGPGAQAGGGARGNAPRRSTRSDGPRGDSRGPSRDSYRSSSDRRGPGADSRSSRSDSRTPYADSRRAGTSAYGSTRTDARGSRTDDRGSQRTDSRGYRSEDRSTQRTDSRGYRSDDRSAQRADFRAPDERGAQRSASRGARSDDRSAQRTDSRGYRAGDRNDRRDDSRGYRADNRNGQRNDSRGSRPDDRSAQRTGSRGSRPGGRSSHPTDSRGRRPDGRTDRRDDSRTGRPRSSSDRQGAPRREAGRGSARDREYGYPGSERDDRNSNFTRRMSDALRNLLS